MTTIEQRELTSQHKIEPGSRFNALSPQDRQRDILGNFTPEQQTLINYRLQVLSSLGLFIGKDFQMPVVLSEPGQGWFWDFEANSTHVDPQDLVERPMDELRFIISHEGSHRRISRAGDIPLEMWNQLGFPFLMNAIEDPRVNNFLAEAYPRSKEQMNLAYQHDLDFEGKAKKASKDKLGYTPRFVTAGFEYIKQWYRESQGQQWQLSEDLPGDVRAVVQSTLEAAQDSWLHYPSRAEADQSEELIKRYANVSYETSRDGIWPEFKKLIEEDLKDSQMQEMLKQAQSGQGEGQQGLGNSLTDQEKQELSSAIQESLRNAQNGQPKPIDLNSLSDGLKQKVKDYIDSLPEDVKKELAEKARQALSEIQQEINKDLEGKLADDPDKKAKRGEQPPKASDPKNTKPEPSEDEEEREFQRQQARELVEQVLTKDETAYEKARREVLPIIDKLEADLRDIFVQRQVNRWSSGFRSGKRIDIKKRMQERAKEVPAVESKAWQRREHPSEKDYAISMLIDLSGSMRGQKISETFKAAVVLAEVLNRLSIKTEVLGFNDKLFVYQDFNQNISDEVRNKMGGMVKEVHTPAAAWNDDGWALEQASLRLARQPAGQKFLFVLSDGLPVPSDSHNGQRYELSRVVNRVSQETDQKLIGLGIGRGTEHVSTYYPNSIANINVRQMSQQLAGLIREVIENYDSF